MSEIFVEAQLLAHLESKMSLDVASRKRRAVRFTSTRLRLRPQSSLVITRVITEQTGTSYRLRRIWFLPLSWRCA